MKNYNLSILFRLSIIVLASAIVGMGFATHNYWLSSIFVLIDIVAIYFFMKFQKKGLNDLNRLMEAIRFSEFNIRFDESERKGLPKELSRKMSESIAVFNDKNLKIEKKINFYEMLLNRIDFAILVTDDKGEIRWINKQATDMLNIPNPQKLADIKNFSEELFKIIKSLSNEELGKIKLGEKNLIISFAKFTTEGESLNVFSIKNIKTILEKTESDAWGNLIRILTHEIMNSITPIISLADTFSGEELYDKEMMSKALKIINRRSKSLLLFIENYRKFTHLPPPERIRFNLWDMIDEIATFLKAEGIEFIFKNSSKNIEIYADRAQIEQVLINMIKNAWEAKSDDRASKIEIDISQDENFKTSISIIDNGKGIEPNVLNNIFVPFFTTKKEGSGIGLSLCRQIINAHGGSIDIVSNQEEGTRFTIHL